MEIDQMMKKLCLQSAQIEEALLILPHRTNLSNQIQQLGQENKEVQDLHSQIKNSIEKQNKEISAAYKDTTSSISRVQMKMMYLLQHLEDQSKQEVNKNRALKEINPSTPKLFLRPGASQAFSEATTPRMDVADYAKSPFAKKRMKTQLQFTDFEAEIDKDDFAKIPHYMRGRACQSELQEFLDTVVIRAFNEKYQILFKQRSSLKPSEFNLQLMFRDQASYFEGQKFITLGDLARILEKNVDKKDDRMLQMLRHIQIIREVRKNSIVCYIWLKK